MRNKSLRSFSIILMLVFILILPEGCSGKATADKEEEFPGNSADSIINKEKATIKFYLPGSQPKSWPDVKTKIEEEISGTINATLDFKWIESTQYMQSMSILDASAESFDSFCLARPQSMSPDFIMLAREGKLKDISQLFPANAPGLRAIQYLVNWYKKGYIEFNPDQSIVTSFVFFGEI